MQLHHRCLVLVLPPPNQVEGSSVEKIGLFMMMRNWRNPIMERWRQLGCGNPHCHCSQCRGSLLIFIICHRQIQSMLEAATCHRLTLSQGTCLVPFIRYSSVVVNLKTKQKLILIYTILCFRMIRERNYNNEYFLFLLSTKNHNILIRRILMIQKKRLFINE